MIERLLHDERAQRARRTARMCYGLASAILMGALALFGLYRLLASIG